MARTARIEDTNGYWTIVGNPISRAGVFPYLGREIGAPDPEKVYHVYRPADELEKAIESFKLLPLVDKHKMLGELAEDEAEETDEQDKDKAPGVVGEQVYLDGDTLRGNLRVFSRRLKEIIDKKTRAELSPGYLCRYDAEPGEWKGQAYDYVQRDLRANHLAVVERGRTGRDIRVMDRFAFDGEVVVMDEEKVREIAAEAAEAAAKRVLEEFIAKQAEAAEEAKAALEAKAAGAEQAAERAEDAEVVGLEQRLGALEEENAKLRQRMASDEGVEEAIRRIRAREQLIADLEPLVGVFDADGMLSEHAVAEYGLKKLNVAYDCEPVAVLRGYLSARAALDKKNEPVALDSAPADVLSLEDIMGVK